MSKVTAEVLEDGSTAITCDDITVTMARPTCEGDFSKAPDLLADALLKKHVGITRHDIFMAAIRANLPEHTK